MSGPSQGRVATAVGTAALELSDRLALFRQLVELRIFEQKAYAPFLLGLVKGTTHLATGQEAVAVGFASAMRPDDYTFCTYRGHDHTLARGASMAKAMGELMGRAGGLLGGKGGSMHLADPDVGAMGSYAIVGAHLPIACGAAWSAQVRNSGQVAVCIFGDGATNIGAFHEALNIAVVWKLPVVFVCENNQYMEYTPITSVTAVPRPAADRALSYGLPAIVVDGNDVEAVREVAVAALALARGGGGPSLIEAVTYRHGGHSRADPAQYRPPEEVEAWLRRDPVPAYRVRLLELGAEEATLTAIEREATAAVEPAAEEAKAMSLPDVAIVETQLWSDGGASWRS